jgi:hypothetical protein
VPEPQWSYNHAVLIDAPRSAVWPWLVQLGQGRGGFYSYEALENLVGCQIHNVTEIRPELQELTVGDTVVTHGRSGFGHPSLASNPSAPWCSAGRRTQRAHRRPGAFHLLDSANGTTRLLERGRGRRQGVT